MPLIQVSIAEGRSPEQIRALIAGLTDAAVAAVGAPIESVRVLVTEIPLEHWGSGGPTLAERRAAGTY